MKYIVNTATNVHIPLDDKCVVVDTRFAPDDWSTQLFNLNGAHGDLPEGITPFDIAYVSTNEAILLTALAIKSEADAWLDVYGEHLPEEVPAFQWAANASAEELEYVAGVVYSDEYLWERFTESVRDAIREVWAENIEGDSK